MYQKWINMIDKLKTIELCARVDPSAPIDAMTTTQLVRSLRISQFFQSTLTQGG